MSAIKINVLSKREDKSFHANHLHLQINGNDINHVIINTLRRTILEEIPSYGFDLDKINIKSNNSVYNNDYIRNRIENFPIHNLENDFNLEEYDQLRSSYLNNIYDDENNINNYDLLNLHLKKENLTDDILNITTDDCDFYLKGKKVNSIYNNPLLVCKLKKNEKLELSAVAKKDIPLKHAKYSPVSICCYKMNNENEFVLKFENRDQIKNKDILNRACQIIIFRLEQLKKKLLSNKFSSDSYGNIILENETHTLGNLISRFLQDNKDIEYAAYKMDHLLIKELTIEYKIANNKNINSILKSSIDEIIQIYKELIKKFEAVKY